ncbi:MAG: hypothetical protein ACREQA_17835 [Candidatus Binatia bacterium]
MQTETEIETGKGMVGSLSNLYLLLAIVLIITLGAAPQKKSPQEAKISITTRLDKTALWVGDTLTYTIQAIHDRDVEFVLDNLKKENLPLTPFVVRAVTIQRGGWERNKRLLEVTLLLSSYESGKSELTVPSFNLYYFKRLPGIEKKETEAQAAQVPATKVGLRSTLHGGLLKPRDFKPVHSVDLKHGSIALILGLTGMIFLAVRSARWTWNTLHSERPTRKRLSPRAWARFVQENLARIRAIKGDSPPDQIRFYSEVSQFLRQYLSLWLEIEATSLTPEEIEMALEKANVNGSLRHQIQGILEKCDTACYGKDGFQEDGALRDEMLDGLERIVRSQQN